MVEEYKTPGLTSAQKSEKLSRLRSYVKTMLNRALSNSASTGAEYLRALFNTADIHKLDPVKKALFVGKSKTPKDYLAERLVNIALKHGVLSKEWKNGILAVTKRYVASHHTKIINGELQHKYGMQTLMPEHDRDAHRLLKKLSPAQRELTAGFVIRRIDEIIGAFRESEPSVAFERLELLREKIASISQIDPKLAFLKKSLQFDRGLGNAEISRRLLEVKYKLQDILRSGRTKRVRKARAKKTSAPRIGGGARGEIDGARGKLDEGRRRMEVEAKRPGRARIPEVKIKF